MSDIYDQDYILQLFEILIQSIKSKNININEVSLPFIDDNISKKNDLFLVDGF